MPRPSRWKSTALAVVVQALAVGCASGAPPARAARPQEPKRPYPYLEREVRYPNAKAGVELAGTLTVPPGDGPFPAALLILGSGRLTRDEVVADHKIFLVLADDLTRRGVAVLRVDKRGLGDSTGDYALATSIDLAADVVAGVEFLKTRAEIDPRRVGLVGHSEGGLLAPMAANQSGAVAFIVALGGPAVLGEKVFATQGELIGRAGGDSEATVATRHDVMRQYNQAVRRGDDRATLEAHLRDSIRRLPMQNRREVRRNIEVPLSAWYRYCLDYDPAPALRKLRCPVLYLIGEKDLQVSAAENLGAAETALREGGNPDFTVKAVPGVNHALQTCRTGAPSEYATSQETIAPAVLTLVGDWVVRHTARPLTKPSPPPAK